MTDELHAARAIMRRLHSTVERVMINNVQSIRHVLAAFFTRGHVLLEDYPGTGKTTLAKTLAASLGLTFNRIQCTPDLLPADILGVSIFDAVTQTFKLHRGPIFTEILLADEINRASPKTQSALLEAMAERQVSLDTATHALSPAFFVIATQNPIELQGTYPLPEAQLDRFAVCVSLGYLAEDAEVALVLNADSRPGPQDITPVVTGAELACVTAAIAAVPITAELVRYAVRLTAATRTLDSIVLGASPRASLTLVACAKALALLDGTGFVTPDQLQEIAGPVLAHRLIMTSSALYQDVTARDLVQRLIRDLPVPR